MKNTLDQMQNNSKAMRANYLGLRSGICTTFAFLPHILIMLILFIKEAKAYVGPLLIFTFPAKLLGEFLFWSICHTKRNEIAKNKNLEITVTRSVCYLRG